MRNKKKKMQVSRRTLAQRYFPSPKDESAVKRMNRWMKDDLSLMEDLLAAGYHDRQRNFTPEQVAVFVKYFG